MDFYICFLKEHKQVDQRYFSVIGGNFVKLKQKLKIQFRMKLLQKVIWESRFRS